MGLRCQWNCIWGDWELICLHLFRKCFSHLHKGSKKKRLDMNDYLSLADGITLIIEKREKQIGPQCLPPFSPVEHLWNSVPKGRGAMLAHKMSRTGGLPSTPSLSVRKLKFQRLKGTLSVIKTEGKNPSFMSVWVSSHHSVSPQSSVFCTESTYQCLIGDRYWYTGNTCLFIYSSTFIAAKLGTTMYSAGHPGYKDD